jgi:hypothetical protein
VTFLFQARTLFLGNNCNPEYTSYLNSYGRCLLDWSHYQNQRAMSALAQASRRLDEMQGGWNFRGLWNSLVTNLRKLLTGSEDWGFRHLWNALVSTIKSRLTRPNYHAQIAEESARLCLAGMSRFAVTSTLDGSPTDEAIAGYERIFDLKPQPLLLPAGNLDQHLGGFESVDTQKPVDKPVRKKRRPSRARIAPKVVLPDCTVLEQPLQ